mgnify:CR=1 FL=1
MSLHERRLGAVGAVLKAAGAHRVLDLGCGEGRLLKRLLAEAHLDMHVLKSVFGVKR